MSDYSGFYLIRFVRPKTGSYSWTLSREKDNDVEWPGEGWTMVGCQSIPVSHLERTKELVKEAFE